MSIRRGAARPGVQVGGKSAHAPLLVPVPSGNNARRNVLELLSAELLKCGNRDSGRGGTAVASPAASHLAQSPAGAAACGCSPEGGSGWNSEAGRPEPEALESALGTVEGAR